MDASQAEKLACALEKHPEIISLDKGKLMITLEQTYVPPTSTFHVPLPENWHSLEEPDRCFRFSVRRVLINGNAVPYEPSRPKSTYARTVWFSGGYSSDDMTRRIRSDREILEMLRANPNPFALLAKLETYERIGEHENIKGETASIPNQTLYIASRPVLAVPDATDMDSILDWERRNTTYQKEVVVLGTFAHKKRITRKEYLDR